MSDGDLLLRFLVMLPLLIVSLAAHELAHGYIADRLGDSTPRDEGRLTLNPIAHMDLWGTIVLVVTFLGSGGSFFFGWAKPIPVVSQHFRSPQRGMMLVGAAGPAANICLALMCAGLVWLTFSWSVFIAQALALAFLLNVVLATLNLLPIPPLDGSRVLGGLLPPSLYASWSALDRYGNLAFIIILLVLVTAPGVFDATIGAVMRWSFVLLPGGGG
ncbi:MAG: site-2 protease family protein [Thermoleophilia bacterium]